MAMHEALPRRRPPDGRQGRHALPIVSSEDYHCPFTCQPYYAALDANVASIMPYGYSTVPLTLGDDAVENSAHRLQGHPA